MIRKNQIMKIYGTDYKAMTKALLSEADLAGCIAEKANAVSSKLPHELCIGIKPNLVTSSPAQFGATTHPEVIAGIVEYLQENHFSNILIAEGSWVGDKTSEAYEYCGYRELCGQYAIPFVDTQKEKWHSKDCVGMKLELTDVVKRIDFLINVPVMKGHCQTKVTCALKNLKGLITNREKSHFHRMGLHKPIAHLNAGIHQDFIVVDHICGDLDFEEGGNPVIRNCIMAAADPVLLDTYVCRLMQYTKEEVPYIGMAEALGVGSTDLDAAEVLLLEADDAAVPKEPAGTCRGYKVRKLDPKERDTDACEGPARRRVLDVSYAVEEVDSCSACYGNLIGALMRLDEEGLLDLLDTQIGIGQGFQGRGGKLGVGRCTAQFAHCIMGCPPNENDIYQGLCDYIRCRCQK